MTDVRKTALEVLNKVETDASFSNLALLHAQQTLESAKDRALLSRLVYGVLERKMTLDYIIEQYARQYAKTKKAVKNVLRLGVYQIYFMDSVPDHAAVHETVSLLDRCKLAYAKKFVNAVLRSVCKREVQLDKLPDTLRYSCPQALIGLWTHAYGKERTHEILSALEYGAPLFVTPNTLKISAEALCDRFVQMGIDAKVNGGSVQILSSVDIAGCSLYKEGFFFVQDLSSRRCARALGVRPGETVLDMCACPGGKTFAIAMQMQNLGRLIACDLHANKLPLIEDSARRLGLTAIETRQNDASAFDPSFPAADRILCDVPCSGFGIIRRKPEIRYKDLDTIKPLYARQFQILSVSAQYLKNHGTLVYSTCTLNKHENEEIVGRFLKENPAFHQLECQTVFPQPNGGDGFFYAVLKKEENEN